MYMIYCEWEIGEERTVFSSKEVAREWARKTLAMSGINETLEELEDENLIGYVKVTFVDG